MEEAKAAQPAQQQEQQPAQQPAQQQPQHQGQQSQQPLSPSTSGTSLQNQLSTSSNHVT